MSRQSFSMANLCLFTLTSAFAFTLDVSCSLHFISLLSWITTTSLPWLCFGRFGEPQFLAQPQFVLFGGLFIYLVSCLVPQSFLALHIVALSFVLNPYPHTFGFSPCSSNSI